MSPSRWPQILCICGGCLELPAIAGPSRDFDLHLRSKPLRRMSTKHEAEGHDIHELEQSSTSLNHVCYRISPHTRVQPTMMPYLSACAPRRRERRYSRATLRCTNEHLSATATSRLRGPRHSLADGYNLAASKARRPRQRSRSSVTALSQKDDGSLPGQTRVNLGRTEG